MNCAEANQLDLVNYLSSVGYQPQKIRGADHWYLSPFRDEKEASFKINKIRNVWYDHGIGKGGTLVDFVMELYCCNASEALQKIFPFQQQKILQNSTEKPALQREEKEIKNGSSEDENSIIITGLKEKITDISLCMYAMKRKIDVDLLNEWCHEVSFTLKNKDYKAIGFKNNAGGYELRNEYFKGGSSPKFISYKDNNAKNVVIFEGFFDLLSYQTIHKNQPPELTNFLVLNSLAFFERSLLLMEKHDNVKLYLDHDDAGRKHTAMALKRSLKFEDCSRLYKGCKDLNEWLALSGKQQKSRQTLYKGL